MKDRSDCLKFGALRPEENGSKLSNAKVYLHRKASIVLKSRRANEARTLNSLFKNYYADKGISHGLSGFGESVRARFWTPS